MGTSLVNMDIQDFFSHGVSNQKHTDVSVTVHTTQADITPMYLDRFMVIRDYVNYLTDYIIVEFEHPAGDVYYDIYQYRDNLEATITIDNLDGDANRTTKTIRCKAILVSQTDSMDSKIFSNKNQDNLNKDMTMKVVLQCFLREYEVLRNLYAVGGLTNTTMEKSISVVMSRLFDKKTVKIEGEDLKYNLDVVPPHNTETYATVEDSLDYAPIYLLDYPSFLQMKYGVYNGHIGTYIQQYSNNDKATLFVYPLIDTYAFDNNSNNMMIFLGIDPMLHSEATTTYYKDGNSIKVLAGDVDLNKNQAYYKLLDKGNAVAYIHSKNVLTRNITEEDDDKVKLNTKNNMNYQTLGKLRDGNDNVVMDGFSANEYESRSKLFENELLYMSVVWKYSNPDLIYPGMPVNVYKEEADYSCTIFQGNIMSVTYKYSWRDRNFHTKIKMCLTIKSKTFQEGE